MKLTCPYCMKEDVWLDHLKAGDLAHCTCEKSFIITESMLEAPIDVAQQKHYTKWPIQPVTFIAANDLDFLQGNVIKYIMRYKDKNDLEDLEKAQVYINFMIQKVKTGEVKP